MNNNIDLKDFVNLFSSTNPLIKEALKILITINAVDDFRFSKNLKQCFQDLKDQIHQLYDQLNQVENQDLKDQIHQLYDKLNQFEKIFIPESRDQLTFVNSGNLNLL